MAQLEFSNIELETSSKRNLESVGSTVQDGTIPGFKGEPGQMESVASNILFRRPTGIERIIGPDDRVRILNTQDYPFRMICKLTMRFPNDPNTYAGSGALIGPNVVLTCAHNLFDHRTGTAVSVQCSPGQADYDETPFGTFKATRLLFPKAYESSTANENDYGVIVLDGEPGQQIGWFGYAAPSDTRLRNSKLNLTGYPGDKGGVQLWHHSSYPLDFNAHTLRYRADTFGGNSGGPIYSYYRDDPYPIIYGIHTYGATATMQNGQVVIPEHNGGRRIDHEVLEAIASWREIGDMDAASAKEA